MSANVPGVETVAILELSTFPVIRYTKLILFNLLSNLAIVYTPCWRSLQSWAGNSYFHVLFEFPFLIFLSTFKIPLSRFCGGILL